MGRGRKIQYTRMACRRRPGAAVEPSKGVWLPKLHSEQRVPLILWYRLQYPGLKTLLDSSPLSMDGRNTLCCDRHWVHGTVGGGGGVGLKG